jgi:hypothetical protein
VLEAHGTYDLPVRVHQEVTQTVGAQEARGPG